MPAIYLLFVMQRKWEYILKFIAVFSTFTLRAFGSLGLGE